MKSVVKYMLIGILILSFAICLPHIGISKRRILMARYYDGIDATRVTYIEEERNLLNGELIRQSKPWCVTYGGRPLLFEERVLFFH